MRRLSKTVQRKVRALSDDELRGYIRFLGGDNGPTSSTEGVLTRYAGLVYSGFPISRNTELEHIRRAEFYYLAVVESARRTKLERESEVEGQGVTHDD